MTEQEELEEQIEKKQKKVRTIFRIAIIIIAFCIFWAGMYWGSFQTCKSVEGVMFGLNKCGTTIPGYCKLEGTTNKYIPIELEGIIAERQIPKPIE